MTTSDGANRQVVAQYVLGGPAKCGEGKICLPPFDDTAGKTDPGQAACGDAKSPSLSLIPTGQGRVGCAAAGEKGLKSIHVGMQSHRIANRDLRRCILHSHLKEIDEESRTSRQ